MAITSNRSDGDPFRTITATETPAVIYTFWDEVSKTWIRIPGGLLDLKTLVEPNTRTNVTIIAQVDKQTS